MGPKTYILRKPRKRLVGWQSMEAFWKIQSDSFVGGGRQVVQSCGKVLDEFVLGDHHFALYCLGPPHSSRALNGKTNV